LVVAHVLVVGAGLAGARVCTLLRAAGFGGRITLVGAEDEPPYDRPPLTKDPDATVDLRAAMGIDVWAAADEVLLATRAAALLPGPDDLRVRLVPAVDGPAAVRADGVGPDVAADAVVVATGAEPVQPVAWAGPGVHTLHTRADAAVLWPMVGPGTRLVVVGGGWVGCEAAATAAARGARVTLLEAADRLLAGRVPAVVGEWVAEHLAAAGVLVRTRAPVEHVEAALGVPGSVPTVRVDRAVVPADQVLVALGVRPATGWLGGSGVLRDETAAVVVDPWGRASRAGVLAVGDAATRWSPRARRHLPGGHWTAAMQDPEALVPALLAWLAADPRTRAAAWRAPAGEAPDPVPYVFSDLGGPMLQVIGDVTAPGAVDWQPDASGFTAAVHDDAGQLLGLCAVGHPRAITRARRLLRSGGQDGARADLAAVVG
jgi:NADPH-dependent 2,4-dienoyl-CoA reductase/sulfur reductase-like enzyme